MGFATAASEKQEEEDQYHKMREMVIEELKRAFRPEFLNRLDDIIIFKHLSRENIRLIVNIMSKDVDTRLKERGMTLNLTDEVKDKLAMDGDKVEATLEFDKEFPREKDYSDVKGPITDAMKEADERQSLIKAKIIFKSVGTHTEEEQDQLKKSTIKKKKKSLGMNSSSSSSSSPAKDPVTGTA